MHRAVFLDRDGVLNRVGIVQGRPFPPGSVDAMEILPGVPEALGRLRQAGYRLIVVTNQPDVATGVQRLEVVDAMHRRLLEELPLDDIRVCYHTDQDGCECRKPRPGMLLQGAADWDLDLSESFMVGDRWRDVGAGQAAGCRTILIGDGYAEFSLRAGQLAGPPDRVASSLAEASELILSGRT